MTNGQATLGPHPLPDLPALDGMRLRVLGELTRRSRPVDIATLTSCLGGHPNTVRGHLDMLTEAGLASRGPLPASGRGRPALGYAVTPAGRTAYRMCRAGGPVGPAEVTEALVEFLAERPDGAAQAREFGRHWGASLAPSAERGPADNPGDPSPVIDPVVATLERMGFSPEPGEPGGSGSGDTTAIRLVTCPLLDAAREHPAVVCNIHHGLVEGLADAVIHARSEDSIPNGVNLLPFAEPGACLLTVSA